MGVYSQTLAVGATPSPLSGGNAPPPPPVAPTPGPVVQPPAATAPPAQPADPRHAPTYAQPDPNMAAQPAPQQPTDLSAAPDYSQQPQMPSSATTSFTPEAETGIVARSTFAPQIAQDEEMNRATAMSGYRNAGLQIRQQRLADEEKQRQSAQQAKDDKEKFQQAQSDREQDMISKGINYKKMPDGTVQALTDAQGNPTFKSATSDPLYPDDKGNVTTPFGTTHAGADPSLSYVAKRDSSGNVSLEDADAKAPIIPWTDPDSDQQWVVKQNKTRGYDYTKPEDAIASGNPQMQTTGAKILHGQALDQATQGVQDINDQLDAKGYEQKLTPKEMADEKEQISELQASTAQPPQPKPSGFFGYGPSTAAPTPKAMKSYNDDKQTLSQLQDHLSLLQQREQLGEQAATLKKIGPSGFLNQYLSDQKKNLIGDDAGPDLTNQYNTKLSPSDETAFQAWKQKFAPNDDGSDYDLRGAFKSGATPASNGHWPDTFKKPNEPTFSNQSQYATGDNAKYAGSWNGNTFVPPAQKFGSQSLVDAAYAKAGLNPDQITATKQGMAAASAIGAANDVGNQLSDSLNAPQHPDDPANPANQDDSIKPMPDINAPNRNWARVAVGQFSKGASQLMGGLAHIADMASPSTAFNAIAEGIKPVLPATMQRAVDLATNSDPLKIAQKQMSEATDTPIGGDASKLGTVGGWLAGSARFVPSMVTTGGMVPLMAAAQFGQQGMDDAKADPNSKASPEWSFGVNAIAGAALSHVIGLAPWLKEAQSSAPILKALQGGTVLKDMARSAVKGLARTQLEGAGFAQAAQIGRGENPWSTNPDEAAKHFQEDASMMANMAPFAALGPGFKALGVVDANRKINKIVGEANKSKLDSQPTVTREDVVNSLVQQNQAAQTAQGIAALGAEYARIDKNTTLSPDERAQQKQNAVAKLPPEMQAPVQAHLDNATDAKAQIVNAMNIAFKDVPQGNPALAKFTDAELQGELAGTNPTGAHPKDPNFKYGRSPTADVQTEVDRRNAIALANIKLEPVLKGIQNDFTAKTKRIQKMSETPEGLSLLDGLNRHNATLAPGEPKANLDTAQLASDISPKTEEDGLVQPHTLGYLPMAHEAENIPNAHDRDFATNAIKILSGRAIDPTAEGELVGGKAEGGQAPTLPKHVGRSGLPLAARDPATKKIVLTDEGLNKLRDLVPSSKPMLEQGGMPITSQHLREAGGRVEQKPKVEKKPDKKADKPKPINPNAKRVPKLAGLDDATLKTRLTNLKAGRARIEKAHDAAKRAGVNVPDAQHAMLVGHDRAIAEHEQEIEARKAQKQPAVAEKSAANEPQPAAPVKSNLTSEEMARNAAANKARPAQPAVGDKEGDVISYHHADGTVHTGEVEGVYGDHYRVYSDLEAPQVVPFTHAIPKGTNVKKETAPADAAGAVSGNKFPQGEGVGPADASKQKPVEQGGPAAPADKPEPAKRQPPIELPGYSDEHDVPPRHGQAAAMLTDLYRQAKSVFEALGITGFEKADHKGQSFGLAINPSNPNVIQLDLNALTKNLENLPKGERKARLEAALDEELDHIILERAAGDVDGEHSPERAESNFEEVWRKASKGQRDAVTDLYEKGSSSLTDLMPGRGTGALSKQSDANKGREYMRMISQLQRNGKTTEMSDLLNSGSSSLLQKVVEYLKRVLTVNDPVAKRILENAEAIRKAHTDAGIQDEKNSTQINVPKYQAKVFTDYADSIPASEIYTETGDDHGRETQPHVTAHFGLDAEPDAVQKLVQDFGKARLTLGKTSVFHGEKYDVLKVDVGGEDIHRLHDMLAKEYPVESKFPNYTPHLTIAYMKKGTADKYAGDDRFEGMTIRSDTMAFSDKDQNHSELSLNPDAPKLPSEAERKQQDKAQAEQKDQQKQGAETLLAAVKKVGGLATGDAELSGELRNIKEAKNKGAMMQLFRKNGLKLDALREALVERGFNFQTITGMLDAIQHSLSSGKDHFASGDAVLGAAPVGDGQDQIPHVHSTYERDIHTGQQTRLGNRSGLSQRGVGAPSRGVETSPTGERAGEESFPANRSSYGGRENLVGRQGSSQTSGSHAGHDEQAAAGRARADLSDSERNDAAQRRDRESARKALRTPIDHPALKKAVSEARGKNVLGAAPAPAHHIGDQDLGNGKKLPLYNLHEDIPGHPKGSTVSEDTLRKAGFEPPARNDVVGAAPLRKSESLKGKYGAWLDRSGNVIPVPEGQGHNDVARDHLAELGDTTKGEDAKIERSDGAAEVALNRGYLRAVNWNKVLTQSSDAPTQAQRSKLRAIGEDLGKNVVHTATSPGGDTAKWRESVIYNHAGPVGAAPVRDGFYSHLEDMVDKKMPGKAPAGAIRAMLKGNGVKDDEIKWSGLDDYLKDNPAASKTDVQRFLKEEGGVKIQTHVMGDAGREAAEQKNRNLRELSEGLTHTLPQLAFQHGMSQLDAANLPWRIREGTIKPESLPEELQKPAKTLLEAHKAWEDEQSRPDMPAPKYGQYQLPGGSNYREQVFTLPGDHPGRWNVARDDNGFYLKDSVSGERRGNYDNALEAHDAYQATKKKEYTSSHFRDQPNYLAHMRLNDRTDADGKPGTFVEEMQSDRHQAGRDRGYLGEGDKSLPDDMEVRPFTGKGGIMEGKQYFGIYPRTGSEKYIQKAYGETEQAAVDKYNEGRNINKVPDAPFRKTWHELLFRKALNDAITAGHDWLGWTTGDTQADRFNLAHQVNSISFQREGDKFQLYAEPKTGEGEINLGVKSAEELPDVVGKGLADKIVNHPDKKHTFSTGELKLATDQSRGMQGFYDNILPQYVSKYVKKWGIKPERENITVPDKSKQQSRFELQQSLDTEYGEGFWASLRPEERREYEQEANLRAQKGGSTEIWKLPITDEMRQSVKENGQPLFSAPVGERDMFDQRPEDERGADDKSPSESASKPASIQFPSKEAALKVYNRLKVAQDSGRALNKAQSTMMEAAERHLGQKFLTDQESNSGYFHGDRGEYTGKTEQVDGVAMHQIRMVEGHLAGQMKWIRKGPDETVGKTENGIPFSTSDKKPTNWDAARTKLDKENTFGDKAVRSEPTDLFGKKPEGQQSLFAAATPESREVTTKMVGLLNKGISKLPPDIHRAAELIHQAKDDIVKWWVPQSRSNEAAFAGRSLSAALAKYDNLMVQADHAIASARAWLDTKTPEFGHTVIAAIENNQRHPDPTADAICQTLRETNNKFRDMTRNMPNSHFKSFIVDYFPHIWSKGDVEEAKRFYMRKIEGSRAFLKHRTIPTVAEGLEAGFKLASDNPADLFMIRWGQMSKYMAGQEMLADLKEAGIAKPYSPEEMVPIGHKQIDDRLGLSTKEVPVDQKDEDQIPGNEQPVKTKLVTQHYFAPESVVQLIDNHLSPGLQDYGIYKVLTGASNTMNQFQLGFSAFHLGFTTLDMGVSKLAYGLEEAVRGNFAEAGNAMTVGIAKGLTSPAHLLAGYASTKWGTGGMDTHVGSLISKEMDAPGSQSPQIQALAQAVIQGGGGNKMDPAYANQMVKSFLREWRQGNRFGYAWRAPLAAVELASRPIMEYIVPRQKLAVFADLARMEMKKLGPNASQDATRAAMQKAWASVDNRMGQLRYDNLYWNKTAKDVSHLVVRSVGWNLGSYRELLGGLKDWGALGGNIATGKQTEFTHRMAYTLALPMLVGGLGAMLNYLYTGEFPKSDRDYFFPRTGEKDGNGHDIRLALPSYMKDVYAFQHQPGTTLINKANPVFSMLGDLWQNKDFYGTEIRHQGDNPMLQAAQAMGFVGKQLAPFAVTGGMRLAQQGASPAKLALPFVGVTPAAGWIDKTRAEIKAEEINQEDMPSGSRTQAESDKAQAKGLLLKQLHEADPLNGGSSAAFGKLLQSAVASGTVQRKDLDQLIKRSRMTPLERAFHGIPYEKAVDVWNLATRTEKEKLLPMFREKMERAKADGKDVDKSLLKLSN